MNKTIKQKLDELEFDSIDFIKKAVKGGYFKECDVSTPPLEKIDNLEASGLVEDLGYDLTANLHFEAGILFAIRQIRSLLEK